MIRAFPNALAAPQFHSDLEVGVAHSANGQKVREDSQHHVVSVHKVVRDKKIKRGIKASLHHVKTVAFD